ADGRLALLAGLGEQAFTRHDREQFYDFVDPRNTCSDGGGAAAFFFGDLAHQVDDPAFGRDLDGAEGHVLGGDQLALDLGCQPGVVGAHAERRDVADPDVVVDQADLGDAPGDGLGLLAVG